VNPLARGSGSLDDPALAALPPSSRARVLEVSYDYLNYLRASTKSSVEDRKHWRATSFSSAAT